MLNLLSDNFSYIVALTALVLFAWMFVLNMRNNANTGRITRCVAILEELSADSLKSRQFFEQVKDIESLNYRVKELAEDKAREILIEQIQPINEQIRAIKEHLADQDDEQLAYIEDQLASVEEIVVTLRSQVAALMAAASAGAGAGGGGANSNLNAGGVSGGAAGGAAAAGGVNVAGAAASVGVSSGGGGMSGVINRANAARAQAAAGGANVAGAAGGTASTGAGGVNVGGAPTPEDQVIHLYRSGRTIDEISRTLGIGVNKVAMIIKMRTNA